MATSDVCTQSFTAYKMKPKRQINNLINDLRYFCIAKVMFNIKLDLLRHEKEIVRVTTGRITLKKIHPVADWKQTFFRLTLSHNFVA